jgi:acylglycerol kinase
LSETVTGLLRKAENDPKIPPIGVLPVGQMNHFSLMLLNPDEMPSNKLERAKSMANAAMAVVKGKTEPKDVMKIQLIQSEGAEPRKPFYALSGLLWGPFNDILKKKDRYWLTGSLRTFTAFLFNGFGSSDVQWNCITDVTYTEPCTGCMNCYEKSESRTQRLHNSRWWSKFNTQEAAPEYSKILNPNCAVGHQKTIKSDELIITTNTAEGILNDKSKMNIKFNPKEEESSSFQFISESWARLRSRNHLKAPNQEVIEARTVTILPSQTSEDDREIYYSIDNEQYEVLPIKITLQPKRLNFFAN